MKSENVGLASNQRIEVQKNRIRTSTEKDLDIFLMGDFDDESGALR